LYSPRSSTGSALQSCRRTIAAASNFPRLRGEGSASYSSSSAADSDSPLTAWAVDVGRRSSTPVESSTRPGPRSVDVPGHPWRRVEDSRNCLLSSGSGAHSGAFGWSGNRALTRFPQPCPRALPGAPGLTGFGNRPRKDLLSRCARRHCLDLGHVSTGGFDRRSCLRPRRAWGGCSRNQKRGGPATRTGSSSLSVVGLGPVEALHARDEGLLHHDG